MIIGEKTDLRALNRNDSSLVLKWVNQPNLRMLTGTVFPVSDAEHELWFEEKLTEKVNRVFGIVERSTGSLVGIVGFRNTDFINRNAQLYIYIGDESNRRKGLGADALKTLIRFAFDELNLHRLSLEVFSYNTEAIRCYEKVGFIREGILRESLYRAGKYYDKILMAILRKDACMNWPGEKMSGGEEWENGKG